MPALASAAAAILPILVDVIPLRVLVVCLLCWVSKGNGVSEIGWHQASTIVLV